MLATVLKLPVIISYVVFRKQPLREEGADDPNDAAEKDILRYLYYIQRGIDTDHVAPLEDLWVEHVMDLLHPRLRVSLSVYAYIFVMNRLDKQCKIILKLQHVVEHNVLAGENNGGIS